MYTVYTVYLVYAGIIIGKTPTSSPTGPEMAVLMKIGVRIMRGRNWIWGDQVINSLLSHIGWHPRILKIII